MRDDLAVEAQLQREAQERLIGVLGDQAAPNVARVEVSWYYEDPGLGLHELTKIEEHAGHYRVHADGVHPDGLYAQFEELVREAMDAKQRRDGFADWTIDDISSW